MVIRCPNCGLDNRDVARLCRQCGVLLSKPAATPGSGATLPAAPPGEAMVHYNWARGILAGMKEKDDPAAWREVAKELRLAIEEAKGVFPAAHALLGTALMALGDAKKATREFGLAIQQDADNVMARAMLILLGLDKLGASRLPLTGEWTDLLVLGIGAMAKNRRVAHLRQQIDLLAQAFRASLRRSDNVKDWMMMSELMLQVHEAIQGVAAPNQKKGLAQAILDAPWHAIEIHPNLEQEVTDIRNRAQAQIH